MCANRLTQWHLYTSHNEIPEKKNKKQTKHFIDFVEHKNKSICCSWNMKKKRIAVTEQLNSCTDLKLDYSGEQIYILPTRFLQKIIQLCRLHVMHKTFTLNSNSKILLNILKIFTLKNTLIGAFFCTDRNFSPHKEHCS